MNGSTLQIKQNKPQTTFETKTTWASSKPSKKKKKRKKKKEMRCLRSVITFKISIGADVECRKQQCVLQITDVLLANEI